MSTISTDSSIVPSPLRRQLKAVRARLLMVGAGRAVGWGVAAMLLILIAAAWADLALDLAASVRVAAGVVAASAAIVLAAALLARAGRSASTLNLAQRIDGAGNAHGEIVAGVDLALSPPYASSALTAGLTHIATRQAADLAAKVSPSIAAPAAPLRPPLTALGLTAAFLLVLAAAAPRMLHCQWQRFIDPYGDHPPYSAITFRVDPGNIRVLYGQAQDIHAEAMGGAVDHVDLVISGENHPDQVIPMFPSGQAKWQATIADVTDAGTFYVRAGRARSARFKLDVITVPLITKVTYRVVLPAYTHRPAYQGPLPQGGLAGLPGTHVLVHAVSNRPLSAGHLVLTSATVPLPAATQPSTAPSQRDVQTVTLQPAGTDDEVEGEFVIQHPGKFELTVVDKDGQPSTDSVSGAISVLSDERPFVRIIEPRPLSYATPDAAIRIRAMAEDDYGISKLEIYKGLNDSSYRATEIDVPPVQPTGLTGDTELRLGDLGLSLGDVVKVFARVEDNDPAGAKGSESTVVTINVISQADMDHMMMTRDAMETLQSKYAQASRRMESLQAELDRLQKEIAAQDPAKPLTDEQRKKLDQLSKDLEAAAAEMDKLAQHDLPIDLDKALNSQLPALAKALREARQLADAAGKPGLGAAGVSDKLKQVADKLGAGRQQYKDEVELPLEYLAKIYPLLEDQQRFLQLYDRQKDLADRLASLADKSGKDDPQLKARMRDLQDEQQKIRDDLRTLLDDIDAHVAALPEDKRLDDLRQTAVNFAAAVRESHADGQMQMAQDSLGDFSGSIAAGAALDAAGTLNSFIARCNGMGDKADVGLQFQPKLSQAMGNSISQLLGASGLGMGSGGGGYSAARNSLQNVGLYGTIPLISRESAGGGGHADRGAATSDNGANNGNESPDGANRQGKLNANGGSDVPVPPQYKDRVGSYFQRVEDELSD